MGSEECVGLWSVVGAWIVWGVCGDCGVYGIVDYLRSVRGLWSVDCVGSN